MAVFFGVAENERSGAREPASSDGVGWLPPLLIAAVFAAALALARAIAPDLVAPHAWWAGGALLLLLSGLFAVVELSGMQGSSWRASPRWGRGRELSRSAQAAWAVGWWACAIGSMGAFGSWGLDGTNFLVFVAALAVAFAVAIATTGRTRTSR